MAKKLNLSLSTVSDWYNGVNYPRPDKIKLLANALYIPSSYLTENRNELSKNNNAENNNTIDIQNNSIEYIDDYNKIFDNWKNNYKKYFALKIKDDSMLPKYQDGDIIIFQHASHCDSGKNCAVMIENSNVTFRKLINCEVGIILQPLNDEYYEPLFFSNKQIKKKNIKILGIPKEVIRQID